MSIVNMDGSWLQTSTVVGKKLQYIKPKGFFF